MARFLSDKGDDPLSKERIRIKVIYEGAEMAKKIHITEIANHVEEQATGTDGPPAKKSVLEKLRDKT